MKAEKQELVVIPKTLPVEIGPLPPRPVWNEHLDLYLARAAAYKDCKTPEDFAAGKELASDGVKLKNQILQSYAPLTQAIDDFKAPITAQRDYDVLGVVNSVKSTDLITASWKMEQDRIAQAKADKERMERDQKKEEARQAEIKRLEEERQEKIRQMAIKREIEIKRQEEQRAKDAEVAAAWGEDDVGADEPQIELPPIKEPPPVFVAEIIPSRFVTVDSGFKGRRGSRLKPKLTITIVDPDAVNRSYCSPDPVKYKAAISSHLALIKDPTAEQIKDLEVKIGGVKIFYE